MVNSLSNAQVRSLIDYNIDMGSSYPTIDAHKKIYTSTQDGFSISVKVKDKTVFLQRFNSITASEVSRKAYKDFPNHFVMQDLILVNDQLYLIYEAHNKNEKTQSVFAREIDIEKASFKNTKVLFSPHGRVANAWGNEDGGYSGKKNRVKFKLYKSFDESKLLISYRRIPVKKDDHHNKDIIGFYVFNNQFDKIWGEEITMPHTEVEMNNLAYSVDGDGTGYVLVYLNKPNEYELIKITESKLNEFSLELDKSLLFNKFRMKENAKGNLDCTGYYANGIELKVNWTGSLSHSLSANGLYQFKVTTSGDIYKSIEYEFPIEIINQNQSSRDRKKNIKREAKGKAGISDLRLREIKTFKDGSVLILGEQYFIGSEISIISTTNYSGNVTYYQYKDIIALKIDSEGKLQWIKRLPKHQFGLQGRGTMGFKYIERNGKHYILFLDSKKNANRSIYRAPERIQDGEEGTLTTYKIDDKTGVIKKQALYSVKNVKGKDVFVFRTSRVFLADDNMIFVETSTKKKKDIMMKIEIKD